VAAARGIALATGKPAVGLTTLAALAAPFLAANESQALLAVINARHDRVYMQLFGPGGGSLVAPQIASTSHAIHAALANPTRIVGNAAKLIEEAWPLDTPRPPLVSAVRAPDVAWVARLGAAADDLTAPVRPLYLGDADAHPQEAGILPRR
jgi:tRNA threonylcarbamoyladenosine biosynthesis protein TsaB